MFRRLFLFCAVAAALTSCTLDAPLPNSRRFAAAQTEVFYEAEPGTAEAVAMAWSPTAVLAYDENTVLYLAAGTRRIVELDLRDGAQRALFDFAPFENSLHPALTYDDTWGRSFLRASDDVVVVSGPGRPLLWANLRTGETGQIGEAARLGLAIPEPGMALRDVDFSLFSGIGRTHDGFVMSFESRVFRVAWDGIDPESLRTAPLQLLAGAAEPVQNADPMDAASVMLGLDDFTHFVELDGWVYFWDYPSLYAVRDGRILTVTGNRSEGPDGELDEFYAMALPNVPAIVVHDGDLYTSYGKRRNGFLRVHVDTLDAQTGAVTGSLSVVGTGSYLSQLASDRDGILLVDEYAGNIWRYSPDDESVSRILGPESEDEAFEDMLFNPQSPYRPQGIVAPLAIQPVLDGRAALVYSPTLGVLQFLDLAGKSAQPLWNGIVTHLASDGKARAWYARDGYLYYLYLDDLSNIWFEYSTHFFRALQPMGVPCARDVMSLQGNVRLGASRRDLLVYAPDAGRVVRIDFDSDGATFLHEDGWVSPDASSAFYNSGLQTGLITRWTSMGQAEASILSWRGRQWVVLANASSGDWSVAGLTIASDHGQVLFGSGNTSIEAGREIAQSSAQDVTAIALDANRRLFVATDHGIFMAGDEGKWHATTGICPRPTFAVTDLRVVGTQGREMFFAQAGPVLYACSNVDSQVPVPMGAHKWTYLERTRVAACSDGFHGVTTDDAQVCTWHLGADMPRCGRAPGEITDIACNEDSVFVATSQPMIWSATHQKISKFAQYAGFGDGLPMQSEIQKARIGNDLGRMVADDIPYLHFWMRDTCTIWKMPAYRDGTIEGDTPVIREITDERLCRATAFAVTKAGWGAVVSDDALYLLRDGTLEYEASVGVEVFDMIALGIGFVMLTADGIYTWEEGDVRKVAPNPIVIDGEAIDYAIPASVYPRMMQSPGENAVLIPVFARDRILKIAL